MQVTNILQEGYERENERFKPVFWISRRLEGWKMHYTVTEREILALMWPVKKLKVLFWRKLVVRINHKTIEGPTYKKHTTNRLLRWHVETEKYQFKVEHVKGIEKGFNNMSSRT